MDLSNDHGMLPPRALESFTYRSSVLGGRISEAASLSALWTELVSGSCKIEEITFSERTCALVVTRSPPGAGSAAPLPKRFADILQRSLVDGTRKSLAVDLSLCPSSVAEILKQGFTFMGLSCWPSRIPIQLALAAHAWKIKDWDRAASALVAERKHLLRQTITVSRPDNGLAARLTPAEFAIVRLLVEGKSYREMAVLRQTSARTVANQVAAAFHRLGVSGRGELMCLLAAETVASWRTSPTVGRARPALQLPRFAPVAGGQGR